MSGEIFLASGIPAVLVITVGIILRLNLSAVSREVATLRAQFHAAEVNLSQRLSRLEAVFHSPRDG